MTPRDLTQVPVEQLARLLLQGGRLDPELLHRSHANNNEAPLEWVAPSPPAPCHPWLPGGLAEPQRFDGQEELETLVAQAMTAAQDAEDLARATRALSRRANRGAAIAMVLGTLGMLAGLAGGLGNLLYVDYAPQMEAAAGPTPLRAETASAVGAQPATGQAPVLHAEPDEAAPSSPRDAPKLAPATFVRVLPAVATPRPDPLPDAARTGADWGPAAPPARAARRAANRMLGTVRGLSAG